MATTIAIVGKGGTGKTTVTALIVRYLRAHAAGAVLAVDADPDANLAAALRVDVDKTIGDLREETLKEMKEFPPGMSKSAYIEAGLHQTIVETDSIDFLVMGRAEGPGCYCYINNLLRKFTADLLPSYDWMVVDNEAGLEHISRQTTSSVDHFIVVVNESSLAIDSARRIAQLARELRNPIGKHYLLLNCVREDRVQAVRERTADLQLEYLGAVPYDETVAEAVFSGRSLYEIDDCPAVSAMDVVMSKIGG